MIKQAVPFELASLLDILKKNAFDTYAHLVKKCPEPVWEALGTRCSAQEKLVLAPYLATTYPDLVKQWEDDEGLQDIFLFVKG